MHQRLLILLLLGLMAYILPAQTAVTLTYDTSTVTLLMAHGDTAQLPRSDFNYYLLRYKQRQEFQIESRSQKRVYWSGKLSMLTIPGTTTTQQKLNVLSSIYLAPSASSTVTFPATLATTTKQDAQTVRLDTIAARLQGNKPVTVSNFPSDYSTTAKQDIQTVRLDTIAARLQGTKPVTVSNFPAEFGVNNFPSDYSTTAKQDIQQVTLDTIAARLQGTKQVSITLPTTTIKNTAYTYFTTPGTFVGSTSIFYEVCNISDNTVLMNYPDSNTSADLPPGACLRDESGIDHATGTVYYPSDFSFTQNQSLPFKILILSKPR